MDYKSRTKVSRILIDEAVAAGANVIILGWVRTVRSSKDIAFIEINDGSCMKNIQGVIHNPESVPRFELRFRTYSKEGRAHRLGFRLLCNGGLPDGFRSARRRASRSGPGRCLYVRADVSGRELEHQPSRGGVLDDRAGNGICRA